MIINRDKLLRAAPIKRMLPTKHTGHGVSYGMSEAGYDIRIKQKITFKPNYVSSMWDEDGVQRYFSNRGRFIIASAIEEFAMPDNLTGIVHDKSTWARKGLSVFNTVVEPGWCGYLTLELVYHGQEDLIIPAGSGIAQVVFHEVSNPCGYNGKYDNQPDRPVGPIDSV